MEQARLTQILDTAAGRRILVIGDVMLDRFVHGSVSRISPEAPVAILRRSRESAMPGGAGNVARNLASLGLTTELAGFIGRDADADMLVRLLSEAGIAAGGLIAIEGRPTTLKTRFVAGGQQLLRVDQEEAGPVTTDMEGRLIGAIRTAVEDCCLIVLSDYAKGAVSDNVIAAALELARKRSIPVIADPKGRDFVRYGDVDILKPNASEFAAATGASVDRDEDMAAALKHAARQWPARTILVTRAARGMSYISTDGKVSHRPGRVREVFDVSGAGDTSLAALAAGLAGGASIDEAVTLALVASGVAVAKAGTATVSRDELTAAMLEDGQLTGATHLSLPVLLRRVENWREAGLSVGFTNGCFDILHPGHVRVLEEAKARCDRLIVGLNADASVRRLKGPTRPINDETARARVLSAIAAVDAVTLFEEDTPRELISALQPDLLVKGGDYTAETIVGADTVLKRGGRVHIVPLLEGFSTTAAIERSNKKS